MKVTGLFALVIGSLLCAACELGDSAALPRVQVHQGFHMITHEGRRVAIAPGVYRQWSISQVSHEGRTALVLSDGSHQFPFETTGIPYARVPTEHVGFNFTVPAARSGQQLELSGEDDDRLVAREREVTRSCSVTDTIRRCRRHVSTSSPIETCDSLDRDCQCEDITVNRRGRETVLVISYSGYRSYTLSVKSADGTRLLTAEQIYFPDDDERVIESCH